MEGVAELCMPCKLKIFKVVEVWLDGATLYSHRKRCVTMGVVMGGMPGHPSPLTGKRHPQGPQVANIWSAAIHEYLQLCKPFSCVISDTTCSIKGL